MKSTITFAGALSRAALIALAVFVPAMALFSGASSTQRLPTPRGHRASLRSRWRHLHDQLRRNYSDEHLGTATGDLRGAVSASLLGPRSRAQVTPSSSVFSTILLRKQATRSSSIRATATSVPSARVYSRSSVIPYTLKAERANSLERRGFYKYRRSAFAECSGHHRRHHSFPLYRTSLLGE